MKKKKLSLKGLEVKSFVTNLDGNLSHTVKGGTKGTCTETVGTGETLAGDNTCGNGTAGTQDSYCICDNSLNTDCDKTDIQVCSGYYG